MGGRGESRDSGVAWHGGGSGSLPPTSTSTERLAQDTRGGHRRGHDVVDAPRQAAAATRLHPTAARPSGGGRPPHVAGRLHTLGGDRDGGGGGSDDHSTPLLARAPPTTIYVIDSGVQASHPDLFPRVTSGVDLTTTPPTDNGRDCYGHGTAVASVAAGTADGVCSTCLIVSVRVLSCAGAGPCSAAVAGLRWVAAAVEAARSSAEAAAGVAATEPDHLGREVVVLSVGSALDVCLPTLDAVAALDAAGVVVVAAAGNTADDACEMYPAKSRRVLTVGAVDAAGRPWTESSRRGTNTGPCVDVYTRGVGVVAAWGDGHTSTVIRNGTSMAAPAAAGAAANLLRALPTLPSAVAREVLVDAAIATDADSSPGFRVLSRAPPPRLVPAAVTATYSGAATPLSAAAAEAAGVPGGGDLVAMDMVLTPTPGGPDPPLRYAASVAAEAVAAATAAAVGLDADRVGVSWALDADGWIGDRVGVRVGAAAANVTVAAAAAASAAPSGRYPLRVTLRVPALTGEATAQALAVAATGGRIWADAPTAAALAGLGVSPAVVTTAGTAADPPALVVYEDLTPTPTAAAITPGGGGQNATAGDSGPGGGAGGESNSVQAGGGRAMSPGVVIGGSLAGVAVLLVAGVAVVALLAAHRRRHRNGVTEGGGGASWGRGDASSATPMTISSTSPTTTTTAGAAAAGAIPPVAAADGVVVQTRAGVVDFRGPTASAVDNGVQTLNI
ncbi:hypothetical protein MMPV_006046 [Pyropia vietnamensis]